MCKPQKINKLDVSLFLQLLLQQVYWKHCQNISAATLTISLLKTAIQDNHSSLEQKKMIIWHKPGLLHIAGILIAYRSWAITYCRHVSFRGFLILTFIDYLSQCSQLTNFAAWLHLIEGNLLCSNALLCCTNVSYDVLLAAAQPEKKKNASISGDKATMESNFYRT